MGRIWSVSETPGTGIMPGPRLGATRDARESEGHRSLCPQFSAIVSVIFSIYLYTCFLPALPTGLFCVVAQSLENHKALGWKETAALGRGPLQVGWIWVRVSTLMQGLKETGRPTWVTPNPEGSREQLVTGGLWETFRCCWCWQPWTMF